MITGRRLCYGGQKKTLGVQPLLLYDWEIVINRIGGSPYVDEALKILVTLEIRVQNGVEWCLKHNLLKVTHRVDA